MGRLIAVLLCRAMTPEIELQSGASPAFILAILAVSDLARARRFYTRALGWRVSVDTPAYVELSSPHGMRLGLYIRGGFAKNTGAEPMTPPPAGTTATELYFHVEDVAAALAPLVAVGGRLLSGPAPRPWGDEVAYVADPDHNVLALARPISPGACQQV